MITLQCNLRCVSSRQDFKSFVSSDIFKNTDKLEEESRKHTHECHDCTYELTNWSLVAKVKLTAFLIPSSIGVSVVPIVVSCTVVPVVVSVVGPVVVSVVGSVVVSAVGPVVALGVVASDAGNASVVVVSSPEGVVLEEETKKEWDFEESMDGLDT